MSLIPAFEIGIWNAWIFMTWLIISPFLSSFLIKEKDISKRLRVSAPMKYENILNLVSMGTVIFGFSYSIFLPLKYNEVWFYFGLLIFSFGLIIEISVLFTLRKVELDKPFTKGPYRYSRHPLYIALIFMMLSISIMSVSWFFLLLLFIIIIHLLLAVPAEEQYCLKRYGEEYQDYLKRTPRWIGWPKKG